MTTRRIVRRSWTATAALAALLLGLSALGMVVAPVGVEAAKGGSCRTWTVTIGGQRFAGGDVRRTIPAAQADAGPIQVRGRFVTFDVDPATFAVTDYTLTGADSTRPDKDLPIDSPTVVFASKVPNHGTTLTGALSLRLKSEQIILERAGGGQDMKIQAKNCPQGGIFQMEPEPGITETNTLGPDFVYTGQPAGETRLCFSNGLFAGYDSPELATLVENTDKVATWDVQAGGRVGGVIGEDAVEGGCTV